MRNIQHLMTQWLSAILAAGLFLQSIAPILMKPAPATTAANTTAATTPEDVQPVTNGSAGSVTAQVEDLVALLEKLEAAPDEATYEAALREVTLAWHTLVALAEQNELGLQSNQQTLYAQGFTSAGDRLQELVDEQAHHLNTLTAHYEALNTAVSKGDRQEINLAAAALRQALLDSMGPPPSSPDFELLANRPAPTSADVARVPALADGRNPGGSGFTGETGTQSPPLPADLLGTEDAALTPEIQALAAELNHDPVEIYEFVRNAISFEPYYGSRKGALLTYWERSGNDMDTASLLIALLRASGYYARYVQGTVAVDELSAMNWVGGAPDLVTAGSILATGGVPVALTADGYLIKEHVWVDVYDPGLSSVDFNFTGVIDIGDIQLVSAALGTTGRPYYDRDTDGVVDVDDLNQVVARWRQQETGAWLSLDASFKQYQFYQRVDLAAITGYSTTQYIEDIQGSTSIVLSDTLQMMVGLPELPSPDLPERDDNDIEFTELKLQQAVSATMDYINAHPDMKNTDLMGGAYVITETITTLPITLPLTVLMDEPITEFSEVANSQRDKVTIALLDQFGFTDFSYQASFPSLANKRVTISYEAETPADQAIIDSYGGTLLNTPPIVDLIPVLRIDGEMVAEGSPVRMGTQQTRSLTFTDANGSSQNVQNAMAAGDIVALGLAYGRTSAAAIDASQTRLDNARSTLIPQTPEGIPDVTAPENMSEPIIGEMLHLSLQAYFNQLDTYSEMTARGLNARWWRYLSGGIAMQGLVFSYGFGGIPNQTLGGGMGFDIQQNVVSTFSLDGDARDPIVFLQTSGYFGSALEHSLFENVGRGAVSSIRLLSLALERGIPVYRIDSTNRNEILPRLQLSSGTESAIITALNQGKIVTVSEREMVIEDWQGVGYIVMDPATGAAGYLISGGLNGNVGTYNGGALWDILTTIGAYAWLAINLGLDLWGVWAGIALLLVPEPTLLTKIAGIALIVANLAALGFDIADLSNLIDGDLSAQQYIGEQIQGLLIEAILKRVGIAAAARILQEIGPEAASRVVNQIDDMTAGAADALRTRGFSDVDIVRMTERGLDSEQALRTMDDLADRFGVDEVRRLLDNDYFAGRGALERVARAALDAPPAPGLDNTIANALSRSDFGYAYELQRAASHANAGDTIVEYGRRVDVEFQRITGIDANGNPIFGGLDTQPLEGDIVLSGDIFIDAKHGPVGNQDLRIWNQIQKAQAAIDAGLISEFRFEASSSVGQAMRNWAAVNAPDVQFIINIGDGFGN